MPISATGKRGKSASQGFTLIEILVVIVVIGVLISIFTLSVGGFAEDQGGEDMRRLEALIDLAGEEAAMQGREIGLTFYQHGYEFSVRQSYFDEDGNRFLRWDVMSDDRMLRPRDLGEEITIDLELDREEVVLLYERDSDEEYEPQIFILSSGEIEPPFNARLRPSFESQGYLLEAASGGEVTVTDENNDEG